MTPFNSHYLLIIVSYHSEFPLNDNIESLSKSHQIIILPINVGCVSMIPGSTQLI